MRPMLAREIRDGSGAVVQRLNPSSAQRVFSPATCAQMRRLLAAVVDSGTGKAARVNGFTLAGKTGTAQKYDAAIGTYGKGSTCRRSRASRRPTSRGWWAWW